MQGKTTTSPLKKFAIGQRWLSESEPDLGLGLILQVESKQIHVLFPLANVERRYGLMTAPLKRIKFSSGEEIELNDHSRAKVQKAILQQDVYQYELEDGRVVGEGLLSGHYALKNPLERLFVGSYDSQKLFHLRYETLLEYRKWLSHPYKGFFGGRIRLIPHQLYVAHKVVNQPKVRVMLADEVGLGKTIEAGLILHQMIVTGRVQKVLIIVPDSLVYQWFVEMHKKFQLSFQTINQESRLEEKENPFTEQSYFIVSLRYLMKFPHLQEALRQEAWDLLLVDEAHQIQWSPQEVSPEYELVQKLASQTPHVLLLSGTPEILGLEGHFARLQLLDPKRFYNLEKFVQQQNQYQKLSRVAEKILQKKPLTQTEKKILEEAHIPLAEVEGEPTKALQALVDRHGTGRIFIRNTRARMESYQEFFPKRFLHDYPLKVVAKKPSAALYLEKKCEILIQHLAQTSLEKTLVLCHDKESCEWIESHLRRQTSFKVGFFHSGMPLIQRDRAAAWFADPEGAQILICTESGAEGRNFEFASHLFMMDLPLLPDLLEQRIGRLDRIGQKNHIHLHVPFIDQSAEQVLFELYHSALNAFLTIPRGATELMQNVQERLQALFTQALEGKLDEAELKAFCKTAQDEAQKITARIEEGQDLLVELNSFHHDMSIQHLTEIKKTESAPELQTYLMHVFESLGVEVEDLDGKSFFIKPSDNMLIPHLPGLTHDGLGISFERQTILAKDHLQFMTWDHPLVQGILEFLSSKEIGNISVAKWTKKAPEPFVIEGYFLLQCVAPKKLNCDRYFPPTPLRVCLNGQGQDLTQKFSKKHIDQECQTLESSELEKVSAFPKEALLNLVKKAEALARERAKTFTEKFLQAFEQDALNEKNRLLALAKKNPIVDNSVLEEFELHTQSVREALKASKLSLDSVRIVMA